MKQITQSTTDPVVKLGDIFSTSWGYEQTNVEFYQVVGFTKSGKSAKLREVASNLMPGKGLSSMAGEVTPVIDGFRGEEFTKRAMIPKWANGDYVYFNVKYGQRATPWNGKPAYMSWYG